MQGDESYRRVKCGSCACLLPLDWSEIRGHPCPACGSSEREVELSFSDTLALSDSIGTERHVDEEPQAPRWWEKVMDLVNLVRFLHRMYDVVQAAHDSLGPLLSKFRHRRRPAPVPRPMPNRS